MRDLYSTPLNSRYASKEMSYIFSEDMKFSTWRKLWVALAEAEKELGLDITDEQIKELKEQIKKLQDSKSREDNSGDNNDKESLVDIIRDFIE